jgi:hypothetical protein
MWPEIEARRTNPVEEQRYDHPHADSDDCTAIGVDTTRAAAVHGGEPDLPVGTVPNSPTLDLADPSNAGEDHQ